jgi:hypothetical protein
MWNAQKKAIALYQCSAIAANLRLDLPVFYFNLRFKTEPAPKAPMASKPKTEAGSGSISPLQ